MRKEVALAHNIEMINESNIVRLSLIGELTLADHDSARADAARSLVDNGWNKLLINAVDAEPRMSAVEDYEFTAGHRSNLPVDLQTAIVHRPGEIDKFQFIVNVGLNRGMNMKLFTDEPKAVDWLLNC